MRISDWSSDVCSSDLREFIAVGRDDRAHAGGAVRQAGALEAIARDIGDGARADIDVHVQEHAVHVDARLAGLHIFGFAEGQPVPVERIAGRSEEHTSELQSLMRISYAVFCLKKKNKQNK